MTPASRKRVDEPRDERHLGPDDDEVDGFVARRRDQRVEIIDGDLEQPRIGGDAGVAGRAEQLRPLRRARERADERVLATPGADDKDLHGPGFYSIRGDPTTPERLASGACRAPRRER